MNKQELVELLEEMAERDLAEGADILDHPCIIAVAALNQCFVDINILCRVVCGDTMGHSRKVKTLIGSPYNPEY